MELDVKGLGLKYYKRFIILSKLLILYYILELGGARVIK
jgi:hypothetical protein